MSDEFKETYRPRLSIEISEEQNLALSRLIPWGVKNELFSAIVDDVIELIEKHGEVVIAAVLSRRLKARNFPFLKECIGGKRK